MFQQPHSSHPKCLHNYESIIILPHFTSHTDIMERNKRSPKPSKLHISQFCPISLIA